jgi:Co/Zn/Cd efflux system component
MGADEAADHDHDHRHRHAHGLVDDSIERSSEGLRAVGLAFGVLGITAVAQLVVYTASGSVALLADPLIGLAITAVILRITWQSWRTVRSGDDGP